MLVADWPVRPSCPLARCVASWWFRRALVLSEWCLQLGGDAKATANDRARMKHFFFSAAFGRDGALFWGGRFVARSPSQGWWLSAACWWAQTLAGRLGVVTEMNIRTIRTAEPPDFLTVAEAARLLRLGRSTAYNQCRLFQKPGGIEGIPVVCFGGPITWPILPFDEPDATPTPPAAVLASMTHSQSRRSARREPVSRLFSV